MLYELKQENISNLVKFPQLTYSDTSVNTTTKKMDRSLH